LSTGIVQWKKALQVWTSSEKYGEKGRALAKKNVIHSV
jgi:hypothetical protein